MWDGAALSLLCAWMAWANHQASGWARITASVFFALITVELLLSIGRLSVSFTFIVLEWLVGLAGVVLLWQRQTTAYIGAA
jgi:hypothetical protein